MPSVYHNYLEKRALFPAWIEANPPAGLALCVVIPAYHENELMLTLESLRDCHPVDQAIEVIIVVNDREGEEQEVLDFHKNQEENLMTWSKTNSRDQLSFHVVYASQLPAKKAGVGLARKIGMDEAIRRFEKIGCPGVIVTLDGDTLVAKNYFEVILAHFAKHPDCPGASIRYAHRLEDLSAEQRRAIVQYELHLRIFLAAKRWTGFPFAFETIGSAMAVRSEKYCAQGGMNTRKAGEDFYFLNKFIPLGGFAEINDTAVFPSARISERVPFGTGRAMRDILSSEAQWLTYPPDAFIPLKKLFANIESLRDEQQWVVQDSVLRQYLSNEKFDQVLTEIKSNTATFSAFQKRFFRWFDAFRLMKYLHFAIAKGTQKVEVLEAGKWIWQSVYEENEWPDKNETEQEEWLLEQLRMRHSLFSHS